MRRYTLSIALPARTERLIVGRILPLGRPAGRDGGAGPVRLRTNRAVADRRHRRCQSVTCRAALTLCAALLGCAAAPPARAATVPLRPGEPPLPPDLLALTQKMEALRVSSERFRLRASLTLSVRHD